MPNLITHSKTLKTSERKTVLNTINKVTPRAAMWKTAKNGNDYRFGSQTHTHTSQSQ